MQISYLNYDPWFLCFNLLQNLSRRTIVARDTVAKDLVARDIDIWWYWVNIGRYWLVFGGTGSVWGSTGWYLVILGQYNLVLFGIKWYWVNKGLLCLYILKKLMVTSTDQPTNRQGEYRAICLFRKLENRKKAEICNVKCTLSIHGWSEVKTADTCRWCHLRTAPYPVVSTLWPSVQKICSLCCIFEEREDDLFILSFETTPFFFS